MPSVRYYDIIEMTMYTLNLHSLCNMVSLASPLCEVAYMLWALDFQSTVCCYLAPDL